MREPGQIAREVGGKFVQWYLEWCVEQKRWANFRDLVTNSLVTRDVDVQGVVGRGGFATSTLPFQILVANSKRKAFHLQVQGNAALELRLRFGPSLPSANIDDFAAALLATTPADRFSSGPNGQDIPTYTGAVWGQWVAGDATCLCRVVEFF